MKSVRLNLQEVVGYETYSGVCQLQAGKASELKQEILDWIPSLDQERILDQLLQVVENLPDAGQWLLNSTIFQQWLNEAPSKLWYTGKRESSFTHSKDRPNL